VVGAAADLTVTTTDLLAAGRTVFGGVEWQIEHEGVPVFTRPLSRPPLVRRSRDQIRRGYAATWAEHAVRALSAARAGAGAAAAGACVHRALAALLVLHQLPTSKRDGVSGMLDRVAEVDPAFAAWARGVVGSGHASTAAARAVLVAVLDRIAAEPGAAPYVERLRAAMSAAAGS
jgi:hypothetical protein